MDYIDRRRARLERRLDLMDRQRRHRLSRAWTLRDRLARASFDDPHVIARLARTVEDNADNAAVLDGLEARVRATLAAVDAEREAGRDVDGSCRFLTLHGRCGQPTVDGSRWCADHADEWASDGAHAAGLWRRLLLIRPRDVVIPTHPEPMSAAGIHKAAREAAELLECGFPLGGDWSNEEVRRWSTPPSL